MLLLLMVMMMRWRKWWSFIIIIRMIISWGCYFCWSIKCRIDHTAKWRQQNCHDGTISDRVRFELVSDLWFRSVGDWYNFHFPPFLLCWTIDNLQNGKNCKFFAAYFVTICSIYWQIGDYDLMYWQFLSPLTDNFYGPRSDHSLPMSVPSKRHVCFINYSGQLYIRTSNGSECM